MPNNNDEIQQMAASLLAEEGPRVSASMAAARSGAPREKFTLFNPEHAARAKELADRLTQIAEAAGGEQGVREALEEASVMADAADPDMVRFALMMFATHHPLGRQIRIPPLEERAPSKVTPSARPGAAAFVEPEAQLNWFREDVKANEHHEHWHVVYPNRGLPGTNPPRLNDRHGELFFYMHQQMLARYDAERAALGLGPVKPLADYRAEIAEGYDPGPGFQASPGPMNLPAYLKRAPRQRMADINASISVARLEQVRDLLQAAVESRQFSTGAAVNADSLGKTEETTAASVSSVYGNHHGWGHVGIAGIGATPDNPARGVMYDVATAIRDPVFYRWHRHVDDLSFRLQEAQPPHDFSDAPRARIRKSLDSSATPNQSPDIILAFKDRVVGAGGAPADGQAFGEAAFGGDNWDKDFSRGDSTTDELQTRMERRDIDKPGGGSVSVAYLDQKEFCYFIRAENLRDEVSEVTVRIFLAPADYADDRRTWIEMDKFQHTLQPSQKAVIYRPAELSSVIRKPGVKPPGRKIDRPDDDDEDNYCSCGWPYNLLLPRGTSTGMKFRLFVMLTDWAQDQVGHSTCGSMSFCGAKNMYPDRRSMGYPFDRPFAAGGIAQVVAAQDNIATRDIVIRDTTP